MEVQAKQELQNTKESLKSSLYGYVFFIFIFIVVNVIEQNKKHTFLITSNYNSVALNTFTVLYNSHHHPSAEIFIFLSWNSVPIEHRVPIALLSNPYPLILAVDECTFWLYEFDYSREKNEEGNGNPLQYSYLENPMDRGAWWAAVHRVTQSDTTEVT